MRIMGDAENIIRDLFDRYRRRPGDMPADWSPTGNSPALASERKIGDFIAGMTDRFALAEHGRLFDSTPDLL